LNIYYNLVDLAATVFSTKQLLFYQIEQERLRQEAIKQAEKERRDKYKKQEEEREVLRQGIRDKVNFEYVRVVMRFESGIISWQPRFDSCLGKPQKKRTKKIIEVCL